MASIGHSGTHRAQSMHSSGSITKKFEPSWKHSTGQTSTQSVYLHFMQSSRTTKVMIKSGVAPGNKKGAQYIGLTVTGGQVHCTPGIRAKWKEHSGWRLLAVGSVQDSGKRLSPAGWDSKPTGRTIPSQNSPLGRPRQRMATEPIHSYQGAAASLVEVAGIEPASNSFSSSALHA